MKAPATFIAVELWHTMHYLMLRQTEQWGELLQAYFTLEHTFWTSVQKYHCLISEASLTLLADTGIYMLVHMLPVCDKLRECNTANRTSCLTTCLQLLSLKHTKVHVMRFFVSSQHLSNWTRNSLLWCWMGDFNQRVYQLTGGSRNLKNCCTAIFDSWDWCCHCTTVVVHSTGL